MGSKLSKGSVRRELQVLVPPSWTALQQLHFRFQQHVYRHSSDSTSLLFITFPCFEYMLGEMATTKTKLLTMFELLDRKRAKKISAIDFFSPLALMQDTQKSIKLEFVFSLLSAGITSSSTLNSHEVLMVAQAAMRGIAMFKSLPYLPDKNVAIVVKRLVGKHEELEVSQLVERAIIDSEILFFMNDLESDFVATADGFLAQQGRIMKLLAQNDLQVGHEPAAFRKQESVASSNSILSTSVPVIPGHWSVDGILRKLHVVLFNVVESKSRVVSSTNLLDLKVQLDLKTLTRLLHHVLDGVAVVVKPTEVYSVWSSMPMDQFNQVRCGDLLRGVKSLLSKKATSETAPLWLRSTAKVTGDSTTGVHWINMGKDQGWISKTSAAIPSRPTTEADVLPISLMDKDVEIHYTFKIKVQKKIPAKQTCDQPFRMALAFTPQNALILHLPAQSATTQIPTTSLLPTEQAFKEDLDCGGDVESNTTYISLTLSINTESSDEAVAELCHRLESLFSDDGVKSLLDDLYTRFQVSIIDRDALVLTFWLSYDIFKRLASSSGVDVHELLHQFSLDVNLNVSLQQIASHMFYMNKRLNATNVPTSEMEYFCRILMKLMAVEPGDRMTLQQFNSLQQALGRQTLTSAEFAACFGDQHAISEKDLAASYTWQSLSRDIRQLGIGSVNDILEGELSCASVIHRPALEHLKSHVQLDRVRWRLGKELMTRALFALEFLSDFSVDLLFSDLISCLEHFKIPVESLVGDSKEQTAFLQKIFKFVGGSAPEASHNHDDPLGGNLQHKQPNTTSQTQGFKSVAEVFQSAQAHLAGLRKIWVKSSLAQLTCDLENAVFFEFQRDESAYEEGCGATSNTSDDTVCWSG